MSKLARDVAGLREILCPLLEAGVEGDYEVILTSAAELGLRYASSNVTNYLLPPPTTIMLRVWRKGDECEGSAHFCLRFSNPVLPGGVVESSTYAGNTCGNAYCLFRDSDPDTASWRGAFWDGCLQTMTDREAMVQMVEAAEVHLEEMRRDMANEEEFIALVKHAFTALGDDSTVAGQR